MAAIGFIGLGNMGAPMAANLVKAGHQVMAYDIVPAPVEALVAKGGRRATSAAEAVAAGDILITMLPAGPQVREVYLGNGGVLGRARKDALLIDCSTIDVETARAVAVAAAEAGFDMLDAPVSGGTAGAAAANLTIMVGGTPAAFARAEPILAAREIEGLRRRAHGALLRLQRGGIELQRLQRVGDVLERRQHGAAVLRVGHFVGGSRRAFLMHQRKAVKDGLGTGRSESPDGSARAEQRRRRQSRAAV